MYTYIFLKTISTNMSQRILTIDDKKNWFRTCDGYLPYLAMTYTYTYD